MELKFALVTRATTFAGEMATVPGGLHPIFPFHETFLPKSLDQVLLTPSPARVWLDGVQTVHIIFSPYKALFRNLQRRFMLKVSQVLSSHFILFKTNTPVLKEPKQLSNPISGSQSSECL